MCPSGQSQNTLQPTHTNVLWGEEPTKGPHVALSLVPHFGPLEKEGVEPGGLWLSSCICQVTDRHRAEANPAVSADYSHVLLTLVSSM